MKPYPQFTQFIIFLTIPFISSYTNPNDVTILHQFKQGLENGDILKWPSNNDDPCGPPSWPYIYCSGNRITQIQVKELGLKGPLPPNLNRLSMLQNLGIQRNQFTGMIPSFNGLSQLKYAYLDFNNFDSIPSDFFQGLVNLEVLALDNLDLNSTDGWSLPDDLQSSTQLKNLTLMSCNLIGPLPEFLGKMASLEVLKLSKNHLSGVIPETFTGSLISILWLNDQSVGFSGSIDVISTMGSLTSVWLHGNHFSGRIPDNIGDLVSLKDLNLNGNDLVGLIPVSLVDMKLDHLDLNNNHFMGPMPKFKTFESVYKSNPFCLHDPGVDCAVHVMALLNFLDGVSYPHRLVRSWLGNDPCRGSWLGIGCDSDGNVTTINLPRSNLSGILSPSIGEIGSLSRVYLESNNLSGSIPANWSSLKFLRQLDLSFNNISPPVPSFLNVNVVLEGNPLLNSSDGSHSGSGSSPTPSTGSVVSSNFTNPTYAASSLERKRRNLLFPIVASVVGFALLACLVVVLSVYLCKKRKVKASPASAVVVQPRDVSDSDDRVKIVIADNNTNRSATSLTTTSTGSVSACGESHVVEAGNLVISVQVLRKVTKNFAPENELGRGGFGTVYKGELEDGTKIAVKRMEGGVISKKGFDEFQSEIAVLSKVRHRHLVSLLGYSVEGNERILVYEYLPQGALSKHLFKWKDLHLEPISWKRRLNIALDVARGMEYLHTLAHKSFIHRDLKSSNILLGDDFRAKVSDFGLVKLAPDDGQKSVATRLAGTFGYLAPEYAVMGKITTKADVFSFGVVLMELLTGMPALDEDRPEESQYLVPWFWQIKSSKEKLTMAVDATLDRKDEVFASVSIVAELAGHCTVREPSQRPEMGHAVNVLASLVEKWKPVDNVAEEYCGIDYNLPLNQMVKGWQESEGKDVSYVGLEDSKGSIPARPAGFGESFASSDGR